MNGLAIDTSTFVMGVAIMKDSQLVGEFTTNLKKNHSLRLMPAIRQLFEEAEMKPKELDRIIVSEGPGSYTGVRIGVTTAKTLAWSLNIPIVGISSLEILAQNGRYFDGLISPFIDARRGQVYTGLYRYKNGMIIREMNDQLTLHHDWLEKLKDRFTDERILFISSDMDKHQEALVQKLEDQAVIAENTDLVLRPREMLRIGMNKGTEGGTHDFRPNYIRLAEAESKWLEGNQGEEIKNKGE
ncbi:tRNA (adenosine(37)-N6)-threonylcarbamoyltransferase complex dimerization subunit type 1 TsaB [Evansella sp. AB-P1]|uniref:tRNA (adenosine(37)-N6)-threonylcarbamoyltransferase complex dimerization subunit type 1 TsaB n=1 Tax=Evansella sp. AB-P1 TaxID=3037653 RepID=UPI00241ED9FD|nr:tRNA (adenosine(37)-N6)-threonylcarbamoyltransferase complex dimerization subunit type 1 TsaB [Evansella sp. AB-P1]MDG5785863.1 tRNA (adenosine(37)-N6)-threonylcarbamoyltransferase complex dimerization subunit type 1 TsaB [Evansella sp. AB-P1]